MPLPLSRLGRRSPGAAAASTRHATMPPSRPRPPRTLVPSADRLTVDPVIRLRLADRSSRPCNAVIMQSHTRPIAAPPLARLPLPTLLDQTPTRTATSPARRTRSSNRPPASSKRSSICAPTLSTCSASNAASAASAASSSAEQDGAQLHSCTATISPAVFLDISRTPQRPAGADRAARTRSASCSSSRSAAVVQTNGLGDHGPLAAPRRTARARRPASDAVAAPTHDQTEPDAKDPADDPHVAPLKPAQLPPARPKPQDQKSLPSDLLPQPQIITQKMTPDLQRNFE